MIERLLIVGHGSIGKRHLRIARDLLPEADIRVLRHQSCTEVPEFSNGCFSDLEEACAFAPQAAVVANPAPFHLDSALALAEAGSHLLVEKPIAAKADRVDNLIQKFQTHNQVLQIGYNLRYLSTLQEFRELIHKGTIGRVLSVRCEIGQYLPSWRPDSDYRQVVSARYELGGGVLLELSHEFDYLRWIFGEVAWVNAWFGRLSNLEIDVEDTALVTLGFSPESSGSAPVASLNIDCVRHDTTRLCTAIGESGSLRWNGVTSKVEEYSSNSSEWQTRYEHKHQRDDSYRAQWQHFLECVKTGNTPQVTGKDGLAVLNIIEAVRASHAAQGRQIAVDTA